MARMRTLKPEACTSETLAQVDRDVRWTFATLWTHCDDDGRAVYNLRLIKAALYPLDDDITIDVIEHDIKALERIGALCLYTVDGREYLHAPGFREHQHPNRPVASTLPECPKNDHTPTSHAQRREHALSTHPRSSSSSSSSSRGDVDVGESRGAAKPTNPSATPTAQTLVAEWIDHCPKRPPNNVIGQIGKTVGQLLAEGLDLADVRSGLAAWANKGLHPSTLPSVVNEVMNVPSRASPNGHRGTDANVNAHLALAEQLDQKALP